MSEVQLKINDKNGFFYIDVDGKHEAMMTFVFAGEDKIIIDHTEEKKVSKSFRFVRLRKVFLIKFQSSEMFFNNDKSFREQY